MLIPGLYHDHIPEGTLMKMKNVTVLVSLSLMMWIAVCNAETVIPSHLDKNNLPYGCGSCHVGMEFKYGGGANRCLLCHGKLNKNSAAWMKDRQPVADISKDFGKNYRHPVFDKQGKHDAREVLPEQNPSAQRHSDCVDCHNPHQLSVGAPYNGIKGKKVGNFNTQITNEYELCYLCHSDSANLPVKSTNKRLEFSINNPSFHPIEGEGKNQTVISLIKPYREKKTSPGDVSIIKCGDCHASDDPASPRGPHGSKYQGLLTDNYYTGDNITESSFAYGICYKCHKRSSILANESFISHSRHITGERGFKGGGTSCYTCHSSHGSMENRYLIRFNREFVTESSTGKLKFIEKGTYAFHGECWLTCHGVDHNPKTY